MLYHWSRLELDADTLRTAGTIVLIKIAALRTIHSRPCKRLNLAEAVAHAKGTAFRLDAKDITLIAANDHQPDKTALRLMRAGVGMIGHPAHRAEPDTYAAAARLQRIAGGCALVLGRLIDQMLMVVVTTPHKVWRALAPHSHTMVSNGSDYDGVRIGAQQPRLKASSQP